MITVFTLSSNAFTLTGTQVTETDSVAKALAARVHAQGANKQTLTELWYYRGSTWSLFPVPPCADKRRPIKLTEAIGDPTRLELTIIDKQGSLRRKNLNSPHNYNSDGVYDPLLDEARKVLLRVGMRCYDNLIGGAVGSASTAPTSGGMANLTDGAFANFSGVLSSVAEWVVSEATTLTLSYDLGSVKQVRHAVARFGTKFDNYSLPHTLTVEFSRDGVTWSAMPPRPVGGTLGDWDEDYDGRAVEVVVADIDKPARYVRFVIGTEGAQTLVLDTVAVYGGVRASYLGRNAFVGYLGDKIDPEPNGKISLTVTDSSKRLADNNSVNLTVLYELLDVGDIVHSLMTSALYWKAQAPYNTKFEDAQVGWAMGSKLTGLVYPVWQGQKSSLYAYVKNMFDIIGWHMYFDGNDVLQAFEPPFRQILPDRVLIWALNGNADVWDVFPNGEGKELRNSVSCTSGHVNTGVVTTHSWEPNSVARYAERNFEITDAIASTSEIQRKIIASVLRDYAWRLETLDVKLFPDFDTHPGRIYAFRTAIENMPGYSNLYSKSSSVAGNKRLQELWQLESIEHTITNSGWTASANLAPYVPIVADPPQFLTMVPGSGGDTDKMTLTWTPITDPHVVSVQVNLATASAGPFTVVATVASSLSTVVLTGLMPGTRYFIYLTAVNAQGLVSLPSNILSAIAGGAASITSGWTVTDLEVGFISKTGPDSNGIYTYEWAFRWTSPPVGGGITNPNDGGFKRMMIKGNFGLPTGDLEAWDSWALSNGAWERITDYIPPELEWDRTTVGQLSFGLKYTTYDNYGSGDRVYWRMWTSSAASRWRRWGGDSLPGWPSNIVYYEF